VCLPRENLMRHGSNFNPEWGLYERGTVKPDLSALFTFIHSFVRPEEPILSSRP
jgi:hypothetical protein